MLLTFLCVVVGFSQEAYLFDERVHPYNIGVQVLSPPESIVQPVTVSVDVGPGNATSKLSTLHILDHFYYFYYYYLLLSTYYYYYYYYYYYCYYYLHTTTITTTITITATTTNRRYRLLSDHRSTKPDDVVTRGHQQITLHHDTIRHGSL